MRKLKAKDARVLIIGSGGSEHALGIQMEVDGVNRVFFAPGNGGTAEIGTNVQISPNDFKSLLELVKNEGIDLVIVGPEDPLANGIVDVFRANEIPIIGPTRMAAQIESNKIFARTLMAHAMVPQPLFFPCLDREMSEAIISGIGLPAVLKISGLAAGKGAFVCQNDNDLNEALKAIYEDKRF